MISVFREEARANWLPDGRRLHLRHGPIDLIVEASGPGRGRACAQAAGAFGHILRDLVGEIDLLKSPVRGTRSCPRGKIATAMWRAARACSSHGFATPMIAVAGAVADHVLARMLAGTDLDRAYVNNGGDIAVHLAPGHSFDVGICTDPASGAIASRATIRADDRVGGLATSGWRGRSHSLGIADAVTVLARNAAMADAAATLIANAIDLADCPAVRRMPACALSPDSDLGSRLVTVDVGRLSQAQIATALARGREAARKMLDEGLVAAVFASLKSERFSLTGGGTSPARAGLPGPRKAREAMNA